MFGAEIGQRAGCLGGILHFSFWIIVFCFSCCIEIKKTTYIKYAIMTLFLLICLILSLQTLKLMDNSVTLWFALIPLMAIIIDIAILEYFLLFLIEKY